MTMTENLDQVQAQAPDLRTGYPRSPRQMLGGYVIAARALDKCRAELVGWEGEYTYACGLTRKFLDFVGLTPEDFQTYVATGATDADVGDWIRANGKAHSPLDIARFNNEWREKRLSELDDELQVYMEETIANATPPGARIATFFDVYDAEEGRLGT